MRNVLKVLLVVGAAVATVAPASAQGIYFGFGTGGGGWNGGHHHHHHYEDYGGGYYRPAPVYQYPSYGNSDCYYRSRRYYDDYRGVWVVRRVRVCD